MQPTLTPLTQALADGRITRDELRSLMQRSDLPALRRLQARTRGP